MIERAIAFALVVALWSVGAFLVGENVKDGEWQAKESHRLREERDRVDAEIRRGEKASGAFQAELLAQRIANDQLKGAFDAYKRAHRPLLARPAVVAAAPASAASAAACTTPDAVPAGDAAHLSLGGVWLWNSALYQRDTPAGACGLADPAAPACAADSGVSVEEAWDNQALNARICAEDRLRHQRLIDFINGRK